MQPRPRRRLPHLLFAQTGRLGGCCMCFPGGGESHWVLGCCCCLCLSRSSDTQEARGAWREQDILKKGRRSAAPRPDPQASGGSHRVPEAQPKGVPPPPDGRCPHLGHGPGWGTTSVVCSDWGARPLLRALPRAGVSSGALLLLLPLSHPALRPPRRAVCVWSEE